MLYLPCCITAMCFICDVSQKRNSVNNQHLQMYYFCITPVKTDLSAVFKCSLLPAQSLQKTLIQCQLGGALRGDV